MNTETIIWNLEQVVKLLKEQNMLLKKVFNSREAAQYLGLSLDSLYHLPKGGIARRHWKSRVPAHFDQLYPGHGTPRDPRFPIAFMQ